ncbi:PucR family transcriptional regulator [Microbacterium sp. P01]|uniref:PucR family transcriptional regulator n=1 Tax=unclassified Microbacterium TaxID=2609290 RepID=UPI00366FC5B4
MSIAEDVVRSGAHIDLQGVVNQLSETLARPIVLESRDAAVQVRSDEPDGGVCSTGHVAGRDELDLARVQIVRAGESVGFLSAPVAGFPALSPAQYDAMDSAAALLGALLSADRVDTHRSVRDVVFSDLLSEDPDRRRAAYATAVGHRWIPRRGEIVVRALLTGSAASAIDLVSFGKYLSTLRPTPLALIAQRSRLLFTVGTHMDASVDTLIIAEGRRRGVEVLGIGTASVDNETDELSRAADQAGLAARFASRMKSFYPSTDISSLGGWVFLAGADLDPSWLSLISPAAAELRTQDDSTLLRTVEVYLDAGGQVTTACAQLFIHRTTLYYRLEKLPTIVREALSDGMQRSTLHFALKLMHLWASHERI